MQKNRKKFLSQFRMAGIAILSLAMIGGISYSTIVSAKTFGGGGTSGPGGPITGGSCKKSGSGTWVDKCFGGMWQYYETTDNNIHVDGTKSGNVPGGNIVNCGDYGGYYRLGLERFNLSDYTGTGIQVGLVKVNEFDLAGAGGTTAYRLGANHWSEIKQKFDLAKKHYNLPTEWGETGYFCYNPGWEACDPATEVCEPETPPPSSSEVSGDAHFYATSYVRVNNKESGLPSANFEVASVPEDKNARISFSTDSSSVSLTFWHKIDYVTTGKPLEIPSDLSGLIDYLSFFPDVNKADYNYNLDANGNKVYIQDGQYFDADAYLKAVEDKLKEQATDENGNVNQSKLDELINALKEKLGKGKTYQDSDDYFVSDVSTTWSVSDGSGTSSVSGLGDHNSANGTYTRGKSQEPKSSATSSNLAEATVTVSLEPGETKLVCQQIHYTKKNFVYQAKEIEKDVDNGDGTTHKEHDHWDWSIKESSGEGYSEACAEIHRAEDSDGGFDLTSASTVVTETPYAGEEVYMTWSAIGESVPMLRLMGRDASVYLTNESVGQHTIGNKRSAGAPCSHYTSQYGANNLYYCDSYDAKAKDWPSYFKGMEQFYTKSNTFIAADHTASKICATFGFNYSRYYNYSSNYTGPFPDDSWRSFPGNNYWRVYSSSCRTIAKKPSAAIWNGSLITDGSIQTSLSPRYNTDIMNNKIVSAGNNGSDGIDKSRTLYGSWSEHLDVVAGEVKKHSSGSKLAVDKQGNPAICNIVDLTIANDKCESNGEDKVGGSGIMRNSAYYNKLETFLRKNQNFKENTSPVKRYERNSRDDVKEILQDYAVSGGVNETVIIDYTGDEDLLIEDDIVYHNANFGNIYQLPQLLIFTDGNIKITSKVKRIDAWLLAGGEIDTCSDLPKIYEGGQNGYSAAAATVYGINTIHICSNQLVFNGPVRAKNIRLNRTFGSDPLASIGKDYQATFASNGTTDSTKYAPAEVFNLRADTYLWAYAQASRYGSSYTESYSRELPPRY